MIWDIIVLLIGGIIIGLLGKLVAPGDKDNIPLWLTILCGIGGILLGYWIYSFFGGDGSGAGAGGFHRRDGGYVGVCWAHIRASMNRARRPRSGNRTIEEDAWPPTNP